MPSARAPSARWAVTWREPGASSGVARWRAMQWSGWAVIPASRASGKWMDGRFHSVRLMRSAISVRRSVSVLSGSRPERWVCSRRVECTLAAVHAAVIDYIALTRATRCGAGVAASLLVATRTPWWVAGRLRFEARDRVHAFLNATNLAAAEGSLASAAQGPSSTEAYGSATSVLTHSRTLGPERHGLARDMP
jgi:hypothetical protein